MPLSDADSRSKCEFFVKRLDVEERQMPSMSSSWDSLTRVQYLDIWRSHTSSVYWSYSETVRMYTPSGASSWS